MYLRLGFVTALTAVLLLVHAPAHAQLTSDFQDGTTQGWVWGGAAPALAAAANSGPRGSGDYALLVPTDGAGAAGRLVFFNRTTWANNWTAASRTTVHMRILNDSGNTLMMRVAIDGGGGRWCSDGVTVPSSADWQTITIPTAVSDFNSVDGGSNLDTTLNNVSTVRILHNTLAAWRSVDIVGNFYFDDISELPLSGYCGDGTADPSEDCDGGDLGGGTCMNRGFDAGALACNGDCTYDTSPCSSCGNDTQETGEVCDGTDLDGEDCVSRGLDGGSLLCNGSCSGYVTSGCYDCGDGTREGPEVCDGADTGSATCANQGLGSGTLGCNASCTAYDGSMCSSCGNGAVGTGEVCDGLNHDGETCESQGFMGGTLACDACISFDTSGCFRCGDGVLNGAEICDGDDTGSATCSSEGYDEGTLGCQAGCGAFDIAGCTACGDDLCSGVETDLTCPADCLLIDRFTDGTVAGWATGTAGPQPTVQADQGPETIGDNALVVTPAGSESRLVFFNTGRWTGDFTGAGRTDVYAHVRNDGPDALNLRLALDGAGGRFVTAGINLPPDSAYQIVRFGVTSADLIAVGGTDVAATLADVTMTRFVHAALAQFTGDSTTSTLVIDNISVQELAPICGDGRVNGTDTCDDGGRVDDDGCDAICVPELCGDGFIQTPIGEECDDGIANSDTTADACRSTCVLAHCGDGVVDTGESCDTVVTSGETCESEGFEGGLLTCADDCSGIDTTGCDQCGDGALDAGEDCDDGNQISGDGCSAGCTFEGGSDGGVSDGGSEPPASSSCGCRTVGAGSGAHAAWLLALLGLFGWRRRRAR